MMSYIKILGVDPSFRNFGYAPMLYDPATKELKLVELDLIQTKPNKDKDVRKNSADLACAKILIEEYKLRCAWSDVVVAEVPVGTQSARAAWSLGIALCVLATTNKPLVQVTPKQVKECSVGDPKASKQDMIDWATTAHPHSDWLTRKVKGKVVLTNANEHLADAVAAVYAGIETDQFKGMLALRP